VSIKHAAIHELAGMGNQESKRAGWTFFWRRRGDSLTCKQRVFWAQIVPPTTDKPKGGGGTFFEHATASYGNGSRHASNVCARVKCSLLLCCHFPQQKSPIQPQHKGEKIILGTHVQEATFAFGQGKGIDSHDCRTAQNEQQQQQQQQHRHCQHDINDIRWHSIP